MNFQKMLLFCIKQHPCQSRAGRPNDIGTDLVVIKNPHKRRENLPAHRLKRAYAREEFWKGKVTAQWFVVNEPKLRLSLG